MTSLRRARERLLTAQGDLAGAETLAREALDRCEATTYVLAHAQTLEHLAELLQRTGRDTEAQAARTKATATYEQKGCVTFAERARASRGVGDPSRSWGPARLHDTDQRAADRAARRYLFSIARTREDVRVPTTPSARRMTVGPESGLRPSRTPRTSYRAHARAREGVTWRECPPLAVIMAMGPGRGVVSWWRAGA